VGVTDVSAVVVAGSCSVEVSWDVGCPDADNYTVAWNGGTQVVTGFTNTTINGLQVESYNITVQAVMDGKDLGETKTSASMEVNPIAPGVPTNIKVGAKGSDNLTVSWDDPTTPTCMGAIRGYILTYHDGSDDTPVEVTDVKSPHHITGLEPCTDYTITVAATWSGGNGSVATKNGTTGTEVPGQSTDIDNPSSTTHSLEVGWSPSEDNACPITSYTVKWSSDSGGEGQEEGLTDTQYDITGLKPCIKYTITVIAYTEKGAGPASDPKTFTTDTDGKFMTDINWINCFIL
ncbi:unnamed protein product, partial [Meganyctiphanes norvegica]